MISNRKERLQEVIDSVRKLPIEDVFSQEVEDPDGTVHPAVVLYPKGRYCDCLSPFRPDNSLGAFKLDTVRNTWDDYASGEHGDGIAFEMKFFDLGFIEAVLKLALDFGLVDDAEYTKLSGKKSTGRHAETKKAVLREKPAKKAEHKVNPRIISLVYSTMAEVCPLSDKHLVHLRRERLLPTDRLGDFFTFPTRNTNLEKKLILAIGEKIAQKKYGVGLKKLDQETLKQVSDLVEDIRKELPYIPGFYYDKAKEKLDFASYKGIGIINRDEKGFATGIQVRRDTVKTSEKRYIWWSSSFAAEDPKYTDKCEGGASPGSPGGVVFPDGEFKGSLCITEGRFKAEKIAAKGNTAVYVSGVSTWRSIMPLIDALMEKYGYGRAVYVMFDSDMLGNIAVHSQLDELCSALAEKGLVPAVITWRKSYGKGFDDMVINAGVGYSTLLKVVRPDRVNEAYEEKLQEALKLGGYNKVKDIDKKDIKAFTAILQGMMEDALDLPGRQQGPAVKLMKGA